MKRLEKLLMGGLDADRLDEARSLVAAWYAAKLERFPELRDDSYAPLTDAQRALLASTSHDNIQRAFRACVPVRALLNYLKRRARTDNRAISGSSDDL